MSSPSSPGEHGGGFRPLHDEEKHVLNSLFSVDFPGRDALVEQASTAPVRQIDENGSLQFASVSGPRAQLVRRIPVEAEVEDADSVTVHVLLHVLEGALSELEIFREDSGLLKRALDPMEFRLIVL
jgi:hypothetical protein